MSFAVQLEPHYFLLYCCGISGLNSSVDLHRQLIKPRRILANDAGSHKYADRVSGVPRHVHEILEHHRVKATHFPATERVAAFGQSFSYT